MDKVFRIMDANLNRLREGLRVIEETARFILNDQELTLEIKNARHTLVQFISSLPGTEKALLTARDSTEDVGADLNTSSEMNRSGYEEILTANFKRTQEAARVLEEYGKLYPNSKVDEIKKIRYMLYVLEKNLLLDL